MPSEILKDAMQAVELLVKVAHCVEPMDHVAGRITLGVSLYNLPRLLSLLGGIDLDEGAQLIPGLKSYEVSAWWMSATILYDPVVLPADLWSDFCSIRANPDAEQSFRERIHSLIENNSCQAVT